MAFDRTFAVEQSAQKPSKIFDVIQTLDSVELAERLERLCAEENRQSLSVFAQIDLANETTKKRHQTPEDLPSLIAFSQTCRHLKLDGLMDYSAVFLKMPKRFVRFLETCAKFVMNCCRTANFRWE